MSYPFIAATDKTKNSNKHQQQRSQLSQHTSHSVISLLYLQNLLENQPGWRQLVMQVNEIHWYDRECASLQPIKDIWCAKVRPTNDAVLPLSLLLLRSGRRASAAERCHADLLPLPNAA